TAATTTTATTTAPSPAAGPVPATAALVSRGKSLYQADGCSACHSLTGSAGVGPSFKGVAGSSVSLDNGQTVTADDAYLEQSIADPNAQIVKGYRSGVMSAAISSYDLTAKPDDIRALVAFIKSQK
ncbi:MAG: c-type cytochrome, partial [Gaiellaceae bacterium]